MWVSELFSEFPDSHPFSFYWSPPKSKIIICVCPQRWKARCLVTARSTVWEQAEVQWSSGGEGAPCGGLIWVLRSHPNQTGNPTPRAGKSSSVCSTWGLFTQSDIYWGEGGHHHFLSYMTRNLFQSLDFLGWIFIASFRFFLPYRRCFVKCWSSTFTECAGS